MIIEVKQKLYIQYMDIVTIFFYSFFNKVIYIKKSHLFEININKICKLLKVLYGSK